MKFCQSLTTNRTYCVSIFSESDLRWFETFWTHFCENFIFSQVWSFLNEEEKRNEVFKGGPSCPGLTYNSTEEFWWLGRRGIPIFRFVRTWHRLINYLSVANLRQIEWLRLEHFQEKNNFFLNFREFAERRSARKFDLRRSLRVIWLIETSGN